MYLFIQSSYIGHAIDKFIKETLEEQVHESVLRIINKNVLMC